MMDVLQKPAWWRYWSPFKEHTCTAAIPACTDIERTLLLSVAQMYAFPLGKPTSTIPDTIEHLCAAALVQARWVMLGLPQAVS